VGLSCGIEMVMTAHYCAPYIVSTSLTSKASNARKQGRVHHSTYTRISIMT
jgi:hypothetical protein